MRLAGGWQEATHHWLTAGYAHGEPPCVCKDVRRGCNGFWRGCNGFCGPALHELRRCQPGEACRRCTLAIPPCEAVDPEGRHGRAAGRDGGGGRSGGGGR